MTTNAPIETTEAAPELHPGLAGVYLATTGTSRVDGQNGSLVIGGYPVEELAPKAEFEEVALLLRAGRFPDPEETARLKNDLARRRDLPEIALQVLAAAAERKLTPMDALRMVTGSLTWQSDPEPESDLGPEALALLARMPLAVAAYDRLRRGLSPIPADDAGRSLSLAGSLLYHLSGKEPSAARIRALNTYLNTVVDHGLNASTFTARVIVSTRADLVSAVVGALGALSGPLHGGAPGPALDLVREIGSPQRAEAVLREKLEAGERLMGFGHRVYKVRDPRAMVLSDAAARLYREEELGDEDRDLFDLAKTVEAEAIRLLDELKPGRRLRTNVEFYTALLLHGLGLPTDLFTPIFAVGRTAGWIAHIHEQEQDGKLIRPRLMYQGETNRTLSTTV